MQITPNSEWPKLFDAIVKELQQIPILDFGKIWKIGGDTKTAFNRKIFEAVANCLGYKLKTEFLRCDFTIVNQHDVPVVFVESENAHGSATHEIKKLCAMSAPIKILLLSCAWSDSERDIWLPKWKKEIGLQHTYFGADCIYVIMVGEWGRGQPSDEILRYLFDVIDHHGIEIKREEIALQYPHT